MPKDSAVLNESYLVRLWRDSARSPWHATVHKVRSGQVTHFVHTEELWAYLLAEMGTDTPARIESGRLAKLAGK
jgi:hypothetical protein